MQKFGRRFRSASLVLFLFCKLSFKQLRTNIRLNIIIMINNSWTISWTICKYIELTVNVQKKPVSLCMKTSNKYQGKFLNYDSLRKKKKKNQGKDALDQRALWLLSPNGNIISSPPKSIEGSFSGRVISNVCKLDLLSNKKQHGSWNLFFLVCILSCPKQTMLFLSLLMLFHFQPFILVW